jgi:sirohydrochlorin ferrochelatase
LLFSAGHAKDDIPAAVVEAAKHFPQVEVHFAEHLGCHERMLALSARRFEESLDDECAPQDTLWLMVGRGTRDESALAEMRQFVERRLRLTPVAGARIAYLAMAQPRLEPMLAEIAALRFRRVVVQPHLLFHGELLEKLAAQVEEVSAQWPGQQWRVAPRLGTADLLIEVMAERFWEAMK